MQLTDTQLELMILSGMSDELILKFAHENTKPADLYGAVAEVVTQVLHGDPEMIALLNSAQAGTPLNTMRLLVEEITYTDNLQEAAEWWKGLGIGRSDTKSIVMTYLYGSTEYGNRDSIQERIDERASEIIEKELDHYHDNSGMDVWKEQRSTAVTLMVKLVRSAMGVVCPSTVMTMDTIQGWAKQMGNQDKAFSWLTPIMNMPVSQCNKNYDTEEVRIYEGGRQVMKMLYRTPAKTGKKLNANKMEAGAAPDLIHSCDATHLMLSSLKCGNQVESLGGDVFFMHIHDSMSSQCADTPILSDSIRTSFCDMYADRDYLFDVYEYNGGDASFLQEPAELGALEVTDITKSRYFFS